MNEALITTLGLVAAGIVGGVVSIAVAKTNAKATRTTAKLPPYEALANRVSDLETDAQRKSDTIEEQDQTLRRVQTAMSEVIDDRDRMADYFRTVIAWWRSGGAPPPPPVPIHLRDRIAWEDVPLPPAPQPINSQED